MGVGVHLVGGGRIFLVTYLEGGGSEIKKSLERGHIFLGICGVGGGSEFSYHKNKGLRPPITLTFCFSILSDLQTTLFPILYQG